MRRLLRVLVGIGIAIVLLVGAVLAASRTVTVQDWLRVRVVVALRDAGFDVAIGHLGGRLVDSVVLDDVRLSVDGRCVAHAPRVEVGYALVPLVLGRVRIDRIILTAPRVRLVHAEGRWRLPAALFAEGTTTTTVEIRRLEAHDGRVAMAILDADRPRRFAATALDLRAAVSVTAARTELDVTSLHAAPRGVAVSATELQLRAALDTDGSVHVPVLRLATGRSRISGSGDLVPGTNVVTQLALSPLSARELRAIVPALGLATDVTATLDARGPWQAVVVGARGDLGAAGRLDGEARLDLAAHRYAGAAHVTGLDAAAAIDGLAPTRLTGSARVRGRGVSLGGPLHYAIGLAPSEIAVERAHAWLRTSAGDATLRARVVVSDPLAYRGAARLHVSHMEELVPSLPGWLVARLALDGRDIDPARRRARLRANLVGAALRDVELTGGELDARLDGGEVSLSTLRLTGTGVTVEARGRLALDQKVVDATADARADLTAVGRRAGVALAGTAVASASARGPTNALAVRATTTVERFTYAGAGAERVGGVVDATGLGGDTPVATIKATATRLLLGDGAVRREVTADASWRRTGEEDRATVTATSHAEDGRDDRLAVSATRAGGRTTADLRELTLAPPDSAPWHLARPAKIVAGDDVDVSDLTLRAGDQEIALSGRLSPSAESDATVALRQVRLDPLCALGGGVGCAGSVAGRLRVAGSGASPRFDLAATATGLRVEDADYGTLDVAGRYADRTATVRADLLHPQAGTLHIDGTVPVDLAWSGARRDTSRDPIDARIRAAGLDLRFVHTLVPRVARESAGRLAVDLHIAGPRDALRADGPISLDGGRFLFEAAGTPYEDVRIDAVAAGTTLEVRSLSARSGGGTASGEGRLAITTGAPALGVRLRLDQFLAVRRPDYEAAVSGDVEVGGTMIAPVLTVKVDVERAVVRPAMMPGNPPPRPDPTITVVGGVVEVAPATEAATPPLAEATTFDAAIHIARNTWVRRPDAEIELGGDLRVTKAPSGPVKVVGEIRLVRGWYAFRGRKFTLDEGTITFTGANPPEPTLDVRGSYRSPGYQITVQVGGTSAKPTLTLSSDPTLDQADILAVILFGKPAHELGRGESIGLQQQALQLAAGYVMPELRTSVMNALGVDTLEVEMPQGATGAGRVSAGRYVAEDVFVSLAQEIGATAAQVFGLEYALTPSISIKGSTSTRGDSAVDLFWRHRY
jgi:autotransporter translocation and assembly factor TamB